MPLMRKETATVIIVTGGAGFIGSAIIWKLNQLGESDILVVDELGSDAKWKNLAGLRFHDYQEKEDFLDNVLDGSWDGKADTIFHMGACSDTTEQDASYLVWNNFEYTKHLAQFSLRTGARFIYASSAATYGDGAQGYSDDEADIESLRPLNAYAFSKQMFDIWARRQGILGQIAGLKYFNVYGPNEWHKGDMRSMVCKGFEQIQATGRVRLFKSDRPEYADGGQMRDFIYVRDAVDMTLFFHERRDVHGLFNIGTGEAQTWNTLIGAIFEAMGRAPNIEYIDMPQALRGKYQYHTEARMEKLRRAGYTRPVTPVREAVRDYVQNYLLPGRRLGEV